MSVAVDLVAISDCEVVLLIDRKEKRVRTQYLIQFSAPALFCWSVAQAGVPVVVHVFESATSIVEQKSPIENLACPDVIAARTRIDADCQVDVTAEGVVRPAHTFCFARDDRDLTFARSAEKALDMTRFHPAHVDGVAVPVYVTLRVVAAVTDNGCRVRVVPNLGAFSETPGENYTAPQRIRPVVDRNPSRGFILPMRPRNGTVAARGMVLISTQITVRGERRDIRIENRLGMSVTMFETAVQELSRASYIPGFIGGHPKAMRYREWHYSAGPPPHVEDL